MSKKLLSIFVLISLAMPLSSAWCQQPTSPNLMEEISMTGRQYILVRTAAIELEKKGLKIEDYTITLFNLGEGFVVLFDDSERSETQLGSTNRMISFEVYLDSNGGIISSNFVR